MVRPRNTKAKVQQTKAAVVYAPSAVSQHGNFMNIGVVVVSCTSAIWGDIPLFRVALQRVIGLNNYQFRRVRGDQFILKFRPHVRSFGRLKDMTDTITSLIKEYLGVLFVMHRQFATQAEVEAILA